MLNPKLLCLLVLLGVAYAALQDVNNNIRSGKTPMKAVALGGWLVAEHWMTTSSPAWQGVPDSTANGGEYVTMKYLGHERGDKQFKAHRDNFITEQDFVDIANAGVNTVRITVGYWIVGFDNSGGGDTDGWKMYAPGGLDYVDRAVREWGPRHNVLVFLSFHGAKGSQNGQDHSGPEDPGHAFWSQYQENVNNSLDAVEFLARRYKDEAAFLGIGLLNEPTGQNINVLKQYYYDAYGRIRNNVKSDMLLTVSPLLDQQYNNGDWNHFMTGSNYYNLRMEWHPYYVWGYEGQSPDQIIAAAANYKNAVASWDGLWLFFGEWSLAAACPMTDDQIKTFSSTQLDSFSPNTARGWSFWAWKQYGDDGSYKNGWSMKSMLRYGFLPHL